MKETGTITHIIGKESKIIVRKGSEITENDFFYSQYKHAKRVAEMIIESSCRHDEAEEFENVNNIIAFVGERGSGKTSCMLSFANILVQGCSDSDLSFNPKIPENYSSHKRFYKLPAMDPSFFSKDYNIIGAFIASIYKKFKEEAEKSNFDNGLLQDFYKSLADAQRSYGRLIYDKKNEVDDIESLEHLSCSLTLKKDLRHLTKQFLNCVKCPGGNLLICIDDIDLNTKTAVDMIEWIRKYLIQPDILILFAVKLNQLFNLNRLKLADEYKPLLENNRMPESEIDEMTERYMEKLFPLSNRIYMPDSEIVPFLLYKVEGVHSPDCVVPRPLRDIVVELIFLKTRYLFYNSQLKTNPVVPRNLRESLHLMRMLYDMETPPACETPGRTKILLWNQTVFKEYLFENCSVKYLKPSLRKNINELFMVTDSAQFNAAVLRLLKQNFKHALDELTKTSQLSYIETAQAKELTDILDDANATYNISLGDTLWIIDKLDSMDRSWEETYFLFLIRTVYSMRMFQYFDELFEHNVLQEKNKEDAGLTAYSHINDALTTKSDYHKLMAGSLFNPNLFSFFSGEATSELRCGSVNLAFIKDLFDNQKNVDNNHNRLIELVMLCTSRPKERERDRLDRHYRRNGRAPYAASFANTSKIAVFDIYSFFYNITDIPSCYERFIPLFSKKGKDAFVSFLNRRDALWRELLNLSDTKTIQGDDNELYFMRDTKSNRVRGKYIFENVKFETDNNVPSLFILTNSDVKRWLSWACFRNAEVYQDFVNFMEGKWRSAEGSGTISKMQHFFASVSSYQLNIYDILYENQSNNRRLNFNFAYILFLLLQRIDENDPFVSMLFSSEKDNPEEEKALRMYLSDVKLFLNNTNKSYVTFDMLMRRIERCDHLTEEDKSKLFNLIRRTGLQRFSLEEVSDLVDMLPSL